MVTFNETETEKDVSMDYGFRRGSSTSVLDNQLDFTSSVPSYTNYSSYQTTEQEDNIPSYEVEREYNIDKLPEDEVIIPTFMPTLNNAKETQRQNADVKLKLNARGKIIASVFGVVMCMLVAFAVYNAVVIGQLSNTVSALQVEQMSRSTQISQLESNYKNITSKESIKNSASEMGLSYRSENSDVVINLGTRPEIQSATTKTNWFDSICNFFAELFD